MTTWRRLRRLLTAPGWDPIHALSISRAGEMTPIAAVPTITLNDAYTIPVVGLGVGELSEEETERAVGTALEAGYRLIDTAAAYGNEAAVGRAIAASGVPRSELFVTTKVATDDQGFRTTKEACQRSLERLGLDYVDLYL